MHPIVLLHGFPFDGRIWSPSRPGLILAGLRPWAPDLPGFGRSSPLTTKEPAMTDYAEAVLRAVEQQGFDEFALVGHSFGGYVALALAQAYADRITGLGLVSTTARADTAQRRQERDATIDRVRADGPDFLAKELLPRLATAEHVGRVGGIVEPIVERMRTPGVVAALAAMRDRADRSDVLRGWDRPLVVVHGREDPIVPISDAEWMANAAPRGELVVIDDAAHMPMLEATDATVKALAGLASDGDPQ